MHTLMQLIQPLWDPGQRVFMPFLLGALAIAGLLGGSSWRALFDRATWTSPSSRLDLKLWLFKRVLRGVGVLVLPLSTVVVAGWSLRAMTSLAGAETPLWAASIPASAITPLFSLVLFVCWDASRFGLHLLMHRVGWLWRIHRLHHTAEVLTPMTFYRSHPIESLLYQARGALVAGVLTGLFFWLFRGRAQHWQIIGVDALGFAFNLLGGNLRHSSVWLSYGPLERFFISPAQHQLHHADGHDRNFGAWLAVWDRLAGTWVAAGPKRALTFGLGSTEHRLGRALLLKAVVVFCLLTTTTTTRDAMAAAGLPTSASIATAEGSSDNNKPKPRAWRTPGKGKRVTSGETRLRRITVFGRRARRREVPGSAHEIGEKQLARFEHNDPHRAIAEAPGVYFREEDGYGLRPNIGMRGVSSERSAKIALMEDGVLIAPAPYAAPAAYYFPLITRMSRIEVLKGPSTIRFGPNTVGGAINLVSAPIPPKRRIFAEIAGGNTGYGKLHLRYGDRLGELGWLVEGVALTSSGFKDLDGGGDTGFFKHDLGLALRYATSRNRQRRAVLNLRLGNAHERSNETYTGLSSSDFDANPMRRYQATSKDLMTWQHNSVRGGADITVSEDVTVRAFVYLNDFDRDWTKLHGFTGDRSVNQVLAEPTAGANAIYYALLTGKADTLGATERIVLGSNTRRYTAMGAQLSLQGQWAFDEKRGLLVDAGVRLHRDRVRRLHTEESYAIRGGKLAEPEDMGANMDSFAFANAAASWAQGTLKWDALRVTAGVRGEFVQTTWDDQLVPKRDAEGSYNALIPGLGVLWKLSEPLALLAGIHRGFVPVAPGQQGNADPERSWNAELGARWTSKRLRADAVGFWTQHSNLKGNCAFSTGCDPLAVGTEFNGGQVRTVGAEVAVSGLVRPIKGLRVPLRLSYTFTQAVFQSSFLSANPLWGRVEEGDEVPYLPPHQLSLQAGVGQRRWEANVAFRYTAAMRDSAGQDADDLFTDAAVVVDVAGNFAVNKWLQVYVTVNNALDQRYVVSYRPFGARPGMPLFAVGGVKARW